jgi:hypothetical protein
MFKVKNFIRHGNGDKWRCQSLQSPLAEEVRREVGIDGNSPLLLDALGKLLSIGRRSRVILIAGQAGVGKKKFAQFFHRLHAMEPHYFHIICCEEVISFPFPLKHYLESIEDVRLTTVTFDHGELLDGEALRQCSELLFSPLATHPARVAVTIDLKSLASFLNRLGAKARNVLQKNMIIVPSLNERSIDVPYHILRHVAALNGRDNCTKRITRSTLGRLTSYHYAKNFHTLFPLIEVLHRQSGATIDWDDMLLQRELHRIDEETTG